MQSYSTVTNVFQTNEAKLSRWNPIKYEFGKSPRAWGQ